MICLPGEKKKKRKKKKKERRRGGGEEEKNLKSAALLKQWFAECRYICIIDSALASIWRYH